MDDTEYKELKEQALNILRDKCEAIRMGLSSLLSIEQIGDCDAIIAEYSHVTYGFGFKGIVDASLPWIPLDRVAMIKKLGKLFDKDMTIQEAAKVDEMAIASIYALYKHRFKQGMGRIFLGEGAGELARAIGWITVYNLVYGIGTLDENTSEFDKVIGYDEIKNDLRRYSDILRNPDKYNQYGAYLPGGILLYGEQGLGKTMLAECFIAESGLPSYTIRKDKPDGDFINYITEVFDEAGKNEQGAIVFLDDLDKFANEDSEHRNTEEYITIQACIDKYKGKGVFVIATVNDIELLPVSLIRSGRIDKKYEMKYPIGEEAEMILDLFLSRYNIADDVDVKELARLMANMSCADYKEVVNEAGIRAAYEERSQICNMDIVKAFLKLIHKVPESMPASCVVNNRAIAVHEAGHVVVGELLEPGSITAATILRDVNGKGAIALSYHNSEYLMSNKLHMYQAIRGLAGKAATEIVTGDPDFGCRSDIMRTVDQLESWVEEYCIRSFDVFWISHCSEDLKQRKERMISAELDRFYKEAKKILTENRPFLDAVVEALLEKEILLYNDIQVIKEKIYGER